MCVGDSSVGGEGGCGCEGESLGFGVIGRLGSGAEEKGDGEEREEA